MYADGPLKNGGCYLDSAATTFKPYPVVDAVVKFYTEQTAAVSRSAYQLAETATEMYEMARSRAGDFFNAPKDSVCFTRNATDSINMVAEGIGFEEGDEVLISSQEHHSNILPWRSRVATDVFHVSKDGTFDLDDLSRRLHSRTRLLAITGASNVTGVRQPIEAVVELAHRQGVAVLVDGAQLAGHGPVDLGQVGCDFFVASGHKMLAPSGAGILIQTPNAACRKVRPVRLGGGVVEQVSDIHHMLKRGSAAFEPGTPNVEGVLGLAAAMTYLDNVGLTAIERHISGLVQYARDELQKLDFIHLPFDSGPENVGIVSFQPQGSVDVGWVAQILSDRYDVAVRHGHHCAQPLFKRANIGPTLRASFHVYNDKADVDKMVSALRDIMVLLTR